MALPLHQDVHEKLVPTVCSVLALFMLGSRFALAEEAALDSNVGAVGVPDEGDGGRFVAAVLPGVPWGNSTPVEDGHGSWISLAPDGSIDVSSSNHRLPQPQGRPVRIVCKEQRTGRVVFRGERVGTAQCPDVSHAVCNGLWTAGAGMAGVGAGFAIPFACGPAAPACVVGYGLLAAGALGFGYGFGSDITCNPSAHWGRDPVAETSSSSTSQPAAPAPNPPALIHEPEADDDANMSPGGESEPVTCEPDNGEEQSYTPSGDNGG